MDFKIVKLTSVAAVLGFVFFASCTKSQSAKEVSKDNVILGSIDGKNITASDLPEADQNDFYKNQKQYYQQTEMLLARQYYNQYIEDYRKKNDLKSFEDAKQHFIENNAKVTKEDVDKFLKDNADSPQLKQLPEEKRFEMVQNYLSQMAESKVVGEMIDKAKSDGKIVVNLSKPNPPHFTFKTEGYALEENVNAPVTVVEFADYQCPYCVMAQAELTKVLEHYNKEKVKVQFVYYDFPLSFHDQAMPASVAAYCAAQQGQFWKMHDKIFERSPRDQLTSDSYLSHAKALNLDLDAFQKCQKDKKATEVVNEQMAEGMRVGVNGTPAIFINGYRFDQAPNYQSLKAEIDKLL